jgi:hypothetical protein
MYYYADANDIQASLHAKFILPAEVKAKALLNLRLQ